MPIPGPTTPTSTVVGTFPAGETVTLLTPGTSADPYSGGTEEDWGSPTSVDILQCGVEPRPSGEPTQDARNAVTSGFTLYLPSGLGVTAGHRFQVRGEVYEVLGDPADWVNPFTGWEPGTIVQVERTEG